MVIIFAPVTEAAMVRQDRFADPSISTVQAPHCPSPQPYFVPVRCNRLRNTESRVSSPTARTGSSAPLMLRRNLSIGKLPGRPSTEAPTYQDTPIDIYRGLTPLREIERLHDNDFECIISPSNCAGSST